MKDIGTTRPVITIAVLTIVAKIFGLGINFALAHKFGAGASLDIYVAAFRIPDFIFNLLIEVSAVSDIEKNAENKIKINKTITPFINSNIFSLGLS